MNHKINKILWTFPKYLLSPPSHASPWLKQHDGKAWVWLWSTVGRFLESRGWSWLNIEALLCQTWCRLGLGCGCLVHLLFFLPWRIAGTSKHPPNINLSNTGRLGFEVWHWPRPWCLQQWGLIVSTGFVNNLAKFKTFSKTVTALKWPRKWRNQLSHDEVQTTILWPLIMSNADIRDFQNC